jgi:hypothetical protein
MPHEIAMTLSLVGWCVSFVGAKAASLFAEICTHYFLLHVIPLALWQRTQHSGAPLFHLQSDKLLLLLMPYQGELQIRISTVLRCSCQGCMFLGTEHFLEPL